MIYPDAITITRAVEATTVDAETGYPTATLTTTSVYAGQAFVQDDERAYGVDDRGDVVRAADARVFLPAGDHGVAVDDLLTAGGRTGKVRRVSLFYTRFYTELAVKWQQ